jgi:hypothetical protein
MEIIDNDALSEKMGIVSRQTDYDDETIKQKLIEYNYDHMRIIKEYMGLDKKANKQQEKSLSLNQQIYKQIRQKLDVSDYNKKQAEKLKDEIENNNKIIETQIPFNK